MMPEIYATSMIATGGREGISISPDGTRRFDLSIPVEMGGSGGESTNPEQLFAAGYSACFLGALGVAARRRKISLAKSTRVQATVHLHKQGEGYAISVDLAIAIPSLDMADAQSLATLAHAICPYSRALTQGSQVTIAVRGAD